jgi:hypothetical protein
MAVDSGYGLGKSRSAANSASRANATRAAANRKKSGARTAKARTIASRNAAASPSTARDKYNEKTASGLARGVTDLTGFNARDGVDLGDIAALGLMIPAGIAGGVARAAGRLLPAGVRIAKAATRVSRAARGSRRNLAEPLAAARKAVSSELDNVKMAGSDAYSNYYAMERRLGSGPTDMLYGSEGKYIQRAKDAAYVGVNKAGEKARKLTSLAERAAERSDAISAADEIKRRLTALQRAKKRNR